MVQAGVEVTVKDLTKISVDYKKILKSYAGNGYDESYLPKLGSTAKVITILVDMVEMKKLFLCEDENGVPFIIEESGVEAKVIGYSIKSGGIVEITNNKLCSKLMLERALKLDRYRGNRFDYRYIPTNGTKIEALGHMIKDGDSNTRASKYIIGRVIDSMMLVAINIDGVAPVKEEKCELPQIETKLRLKKQILGCEDVEIGTIGVVIKSSDSRVVVSLIGHHGRTMSLNVQGIKEEWEVVEDKPVWDEHWSRGNSESLGGIRFIYRAKRIGDKVDSVDVILDGEERIASASNPDDKELGLESLINVAVMRALSYSLESEINKIME